MNKLTILSKAGNESVIRIDRYATFYLLRVEENSRKEHGNNIEIEEARVFLSKAALKELLYTIVDILEKRGGSKPRWVTISEATNHIVYHDADERE